MKHQRKSRKEIKQNVDKHYGNMAEHKPKSEASRKFARKPYDYTIYKKE